MAGIPIGYIKQQLECQNPVARIMPNTNAKLDTQLLALVFQATLTLNLKMKLTIWLKHLVQ